jgi:phosphate transport system protein
MTESHIVKSYDEELNKLTSLVIEMGGLAETQVAGSIRSIVKRDVEFADRIINADVKLDDLEHEIEAFVIKMLALRQPMADDLRKIISALKISSDLERIGDYAKNVAKRAIPISEASQVNPVHVIPRMGVMVQQMIKDTLDAYVSEDADKAVAARNKDEEVDEIYNSLFRELLTYMMEDPRSITTCTHLLFVAKNIERIGDHATNIAETVYFMVRGKPMLEERPKGDTTSFTVV